MIADLRKQVLKGEHIVLSGIIPLGQQPCDNFFYKLCVQHGAVIDEHIGESTTVVVASRMGTE